MSDGFQVELEDFINFFSHKNYEKSRRFNQGFTYDPEPLKLFLQELENPQQHYRSIHVAGTTGKGSISTLMSRALGTLSPTGLYISPHLENLLERISIQDKNKSENISLDQFLEIWKTIKKIKLVHDISFFDALTAIAMIYFKNKNLEWSVFETGLGGKYDSTNNLMPDMCIITPIGFDHQNILGDTIEKITMEKGGIIKPGIPVYAWVENPEARRCLDKISDEKMAPLKYFELKKDLDFTEENHLFAKWIFEDYFKTGFPAINLQIQGRLEVLNHSPEIIFDSAHNLVSMEKLLFWVTRNPGKWRIYLNMMKERDIHKIINFIKSKITDDLQIEIYLFPVNEPGYYNLQDLDHLTEMSMDHLRNNDFRHLITGSMRLYLKAKEIVKIFS